MYQVAEESTKESSSTSQSPVLKPFTQSFHISFFFVVRSGCNQALVLGGQADAGIEVAAQLICGVGAAVVFAEEVHGIILRDGYIVVSRLHALNLFEERVTWMQMPASKTKPMATASMVRLVATAVMASLMSLFGRILRVRKSWYLGSRSLCARWPRRGGSASSLMSSSTSSALSSCSCIM
jgi:hypothetical protein